MTASSLLTLCKIHVNTCRLHRINHPVTSATYEIFDDRCLDDYPEPELLS